MQATIRRWTSDNVCRSEISKPLRTVHVSVWYRLFAQGSWDAQPQALSTGINTSSCICNRRPLAIILPQIQNVCASDRLELRTSSTLSSFVVSDTAPMSELALMATSLKNANVSCTYQTLNWSLISQESTLSVSIFEGSAWSTIPTCPA